MDEEYINLCTTSWQLLDRSRTLELYSFFDTVDCNTRYAVKRYGKVVYDFDKDQHGNIDIFFEALSALDDFYI